MANITNSNTYWAVVPAAGIGKRMGLDIAKQYLKINNTTVIEHTLHKLTNCSSIKNIIVAISSQDSRWQNIAKHLPDSIHTVTGGKQRSDSVLAALNYLAQYADDDDWVLVHDAARPCVLSEDIEQLINKVSSHPVGGVLGTPVRDTMKHVKVDTGQIIITTTYDRSTIWHALTPQMFRLGMLRDAIEYARRKNIAITDEASAIEATGNKPLMVVGKASNIKITRPEDIPLAGYYLEQEQG